MRIACTLAPGRGDTDLLLQGLARRLASDGVKVCGTVQINGEVPCDGPCDMDVQCLPDGPIIRISQSLGKHARGCRLNPDALEQAVGWVEARIADDIDLLVVNKFGKHEADGRGFRTAIAQALEADIPVVVGLNSMNRAAFHDFTGGAADEIAPEPSALLAWARAAHS
jgi:nucleoside-triphosphatase THEP1